LFSLFFFLSVCVRVHVRVRAKRERENSPHSFIHNQAEYEFSKVKYWLQTIRSLAHPQSPIVLVGTHTDLPSCSAPYLEYVKNQMSQLINGKRGLHKTQNDVW
jgi:hypothetical protein